MKGKGLAKEGFVERYRISQKDIKELLGGKHLAKEYKCFVERSRFSQKMI